MVGGSRDCGGLGCRCDGRGSSCDGCGVRGSCCSKGGDEVARENVCVNEKGGSGAGGDVRGREVCICGEEVGDCGGMEDDRDVTGGVDVEDCCCNEEGGSGSGDGGSINEEEGCDIAGGGFAEESMHPPFRRVQHGTESSVCPGEAAELAVARLSWSALPCLTLGE